MSAKSVADQIREMLEMDSVVWDEVPMMLRNMLENHPELERVGQEGMVVVPDGEHMTELMLDASRKVWLYFTSGGDGRMTYGLLRHLATCDPRAIKWLPHWVFKYDQHVTKSACADIAHTVTVNAFLDPNPDMPAGEDVIALINDADLKAALQRKLDWYHTPPEKKHELQLSLAGRIFSKFVLELVDDQGTRDFLTVMPYPALSFVGEAGRLTQEASVHVARHQLPKAWQKMISRKGGRILFSLTPQRTISRGPYFYANSEPTSGLDKVALTCTRMMGYCGAGEIEFTIKQENVPNE